MHRVSNTMQHCPRRRPAELADRVANAAVLLAVLSLALAQGCTDNWIPDSGTDRQEQRAQALSQAGSHGSAAQIYERLAAATPQGRRDEYLTRAVESWYAAGDVGRAASALRRMTSPPPAGASPVFTVLNAMLSLQEGQPREALEQLAALPEPAPDNVAPFAMEITGRARFRLGDAPGATRALADREIWLPDRAGVLANHRILWDGLTGIARSGGDLSVAPGTQEPVAGWLRLAALWAGAQASGEAFEPMAAGWRAANPDHPASTGLLDEVLGIPLPAMQFPGSVALILPVTGRLQMPGEAVRDGFIAAYLADTEAVTRPTVRIYDTNTLGAAGAYQRALEEGAGMIVGPLSKTEVQEAAVAAVRQVTTLALNYLPDEHTPPPAFFQFGLAPEDEAKRAAENALVYGYTRAVALVSADVWGGRMLNSFATAFESIGGTLLEHASYDPQASDHRAPIRSLLHLDLSEQRKRSLAARLGLDLEFQPRRREDAEFIFLASQPEPGRQLRPQLKFHYALELPVFATAAIYEPDDRANSDLDGVMFADMPWIVTPDTESLRLRNEFRSLWPRRFGRVQRLYALGYDAYGLIPILHNQPPPMETPVAGLTGTLTVDATGRVHRQLEWARIENGAVTRAILPSTEPEAIEPSAAGVTAARRR